ncbi:hypothetical protein MBM_04228 [Drepanopeziza brunnea f. sp. 'multigermtubi' MB_m1]|uniref:Uncharacterized protein n=1 Tax=Marssonina brunnea f. sp. multigermtubi (strain MB_m1) TaxID=1072389 RepID=K1WXT1_MARBU|nr:uncharacterized protein MBM_04228 [Drepanopeziza brunnea f. sp. 'multigermtubi' MB_m1]EKD17367.1 hypothetical protein MBM_04228 [Drepanopeziza brunnea f. sp. 'multigermtubi' MB_m1]
MEYWYAEEIKPETIRTPPPDDQPVVANPKKSQGHSLNDSYLQEGRQRSEEKLLTAAGAGKDGATAAGASAGAGVKTEEGGTQPEPEPKTEDESQAQAKKAKKGLCGCDLM